MHIGQALAIIYSFASSWVPGLSRLLPPDTIRLIFESINTGLEEKLKVDFKFYNWIGIVMTLKEIAEAVIYNTQEERVQAAYALLVLITNIEDHMTLEQFSTRVNGIPEVARVL
jgi:hypothetical protein